MKKKHRQCWIFFPLVMVFPLHQTTPNLKGAIGSGKGASDKDSAGTIQMRDVSATRRNENEPVCLTF